MATKKPLWRCPNCGERFANENQWHSCGDFSIDTLFARSEPNVRAVYERLLTIAERLGPLRAIPQKTRVTLQTRVRFLSMYPRKKHLLCGFLFARVVKHARFTKVESFSKRNHVHNLQLADVAEIDSEVERWIAEARAVGDQDHLGD